MDDPRLPDFSPTSIQAMPDQFHLLSGQKYDGREHLPIIPSDLESHIEGMAASGVDVPGDLPQLLDRHYFDFTNGFRVFVVFWQAGTIPEREDSPLNLPDEAREQSFFTAAPYLGRKSAEVPSTPRDLYKSTRSMVRALRGGIYESPTYWSQGNRTILLLYTLD